jgi:glyoxylase-like metal-dependent hydrolase (beta-lactamase superfamily II)
MRRFTLFVVFLSVLAAGFLATRGDAQPNTVKEIVKGVWFREGDIEHQGHCNNAIIEMDKYLIVVDANFPSGARAVLEDAKKVSSKPVKLVFDTHHHGDHAYGNPVWTKMGAVTLAYSAVADEMKRYEPKRFQATIKQREDVAGLQATAPEPPSKTFSDPLHVVEDPTRRVEFRFFGWAHTRGDGFVYLPKEKVLCSGDAAVNGPYNYTADGNIDNWPKVIAQAQKLDVQYVLPGHGPSGGKEILANQAAFFIELRRAVEEAVKGGKKLDDIVTMADGQPKATTLKLSDKVRTYVGDPLAAQVKDAYSELTSGKPAGDLPHQ